MNLFIDNRVGAGGTIGAGEAAHARGRRLHAVSRQLDDASPQPDADAEGALRSARGFLGRLHLRRRYRYDRGSSLGAGARPPELVAFIKARAGQLSYGSAGAGSDSHLAGEVFKHLGGGLDLAHIAYKGGSPALSDLVGGHIPIASLHMTPQLLALHRSGEICVLAVTGPTRLAVAPDIPTGEEAGMPGLIATTFNGILAPAGTSAVIIERLDAATQKAMASADFAKALTDAGFEPLKGVGVLGCPALHRR